MKPLPSLDAAFAGTAAERAARVAVAWLGTLKPATAASYASYVRHYLAWCVTELVDPLGVRISTAAAYQSHLATTGSGEARSVASIAAALAGLGRLVEFAVLDGARDETVPNPWPRLPRGQRVPSRPRHRLSGDEAVRLVVATSRDGVLRGLLGKAVVGLLVGLGLRPSDACRLDTGALWRGDDGRWLLDVVGKRGRHLVHELPDELVEAIVAYQRRGRREPDTQRYPGSAGALFVHPRLYRRLDRRDVLALVKRCSAAAELRAGRALTCVDVRRFALARARDTGGVEAARRLAGHVTEDTTRRYLDDTDVIRIGRSVLATLPDWPSTSLSELVEHAFDQHEVRRPENTCTCLVPWRHARVHLEPLGIDETAGITPLDDGWSGIENVLDWPVCVCRAVYVGGYLVKTTGDTRLENLLRDATLYPEAVQRREERRRDQH